FLVDRRFPPERGSSGDRARAAGSGDGGGDRRRSSGRDPEAGPRLLGPAFPCPLPPARPRTPELRPRLPGTGSGATLVRCSAEGRGIPRSPRRTLRRAIRRGVDPRPPPSPSPPTRGRPTPGPLGEGSGDPSTPSPDPSRSPPARG